MDGINDSEPLRLLGESRTTGEALSLEFFHGYEGLISLAGESNLRNLMLYLKYHYLGETTEAQIRISSALASRCNLSESWLQAVQERKRTDLKNVRIQKDAYRQACWMEGYDVDELDRMLITSVSQESTFPTSLYIHPEPATEQQHKSWWDVLHHVGPQNWNA